MQEHCGGMFVSGHRFTKSDVSQVLQTIRERIVVGVPGFPEPVSIRKFFWREGCKPQQIVRTIFNHIDPQIISRIDTEIWSVFVPKSYALELHQTVERGVFHSLD